MMDLPDEARTAVAALRDGLIAAVGADFVSLVVHGSAVRGGWDPAVSDIDVIVVLRDTSLRLLTACADPLAAARHRSRVEAMVLKDGEVGRASDVFPVFYDDIRACHAVVHGPDPFASLDIRDEHRRLRIEQELREVKIRTRRAVVDALGDERLLAGALRRKVRQLRSPLHALLRLVDDPPADDGFTTVWRAVGKRYAQDVAPILAEPMDVPAAHEAFRRMLDAAIAEVDRLGEGAPRGELR